LRTVQGLVDDPGPVARPAEDAAKKRAQSDHRPLSAISTMPPNQISRPGSKMISSRRYRDAL
jgi:hypothetical protein